MQANGYQLVRLDRSRTLNKRGSGLCLYIKKGLTVEKLDIDMSKADIELMGVKIPRPKQKNIIVLLTYRQPTGNFEVFCETVTVVVQSLSGRDDWVIMGDFNANYMNK